MSVNTTSELGTTFFRARAHPVKYVKNERPEILKCQDFTKFIEQYREYYVDKTLYIKKVLENTKDKVIVVSKPKDMGKSMSLSMLATFLDCSLNKFKVSCVFQGT
jgi:hypothetical protein